MQDIFKKPFFIIKSISKTNVYRTIDRNKQNCIIKYTYLTLIKNYCKSNIELYEK